MIRRDLFQHGEKKKIPEKAKATSLQPSWFHTGKKKEEAAGMSEQNVYRNMISSSQVVSLLIGAVKPY